MSADDNEVDMNTEIKIEGEMVTLADIAGINLDNIEELRGGESFPRGIFAWEVTLDNDGKPPHLKIIGEGDKKKACAGYAFKCIEVMSVNDPEFTADPDTLVGKTHNEINLIGSGNSSVEKSLGYIKSFLKDMGAPYNPDLNKNLAGSLGTRFIAPITKMKSRDDADKVFTNINRLKIKPLMAAPVSDVTKAVA